jgi:predicted enzyme related to lactoylglutathione lyase
MTESAIRLIVTELRVADLERALHFYRELLGLPFADIERHADDDVPHAHASWGSWRVDQHFVRLNIYPRGVRQATYTVLGFLVNDLGTMHERLLRAGVEVLLAPEQKTWGRTASYRDPDGNEVGLTELRAIATRALVEDSAESTPS